MITQVCHHYKKGKTPEVIAEDLVETVDTVMDICKIIDSFESEYTVEQIWRSLIVGMSIT